MLGKSYRYVLVLLCLLVLVPIIPAAAQEIGADDLYFAWSPDGTQIAFVSYRAGQADLYVMDTAGGEPRLLAEGNGAGIYGLIWSLDSTFLLYSSNVGNKSAIYRVDLADGTSSVLIDNEYNNYIQEWSLDGTQALYQSWNDDVSTLSLLDIATGESEVLDIGDLQNATTRGWSPDGSRLAISGTNAATELEELYVYDLDSGTLSDNLLRNYWDRNLECCAVWADWSPDSSAVAFSKTQDGNLYTIDLETETIQSAAYAGGPIQFFVWTPENQLVYLVNWRDDTLTDIDVSAPAGVYMVSPEDREPKALIEGIVTGMFVAPDGKHVLVHNTFQDDYRGVFQPRSMKLVNLETLEVTEVNTQERNLLNVEWSPDNTKVAAALCVDGDYDIFVIDVATAEFTNLTPEDAFTGEPLGTQCAGAG